MSGVLLKSTLLPTNFDDVMHLVVVQYKTFLQEAQLYLNFKQEHKYFLIMAIKKRAGE